MAFSNPGSTPVLGFLEVPRPPPKKTPPKIQELSAKLGECSVEAEEETDEESLQNDVLHLQEEIGEAISDVLSCPLSEGDISYIDHVQRCCLALNNLMAHIKSEFYSK